MSRVVVVHQWSSNPNKDWYPWAKEEIEKKGYQVIIPEMPDTNHPVIEKWVSKLGEVVGKVREDDVFVGHSVGCQTILRFLEQLPTNKKLEKVIMVAPWFRLTPTGLAKNSN